MKAITTLGSALLILFSFSSCEQADLPEPASQTAQQLGKKGGATSGGTTTISTIYGGRATSLDATIWNMQSATVTSNQSIFAQTNFLPASGGAEAASQLQAEIPGALTAENLQSSTTGQNNSTTSESSLTNLNLTVGGHVITATYVSATANAVCGPVRTGSSVLNGLVIDGTPVVVTGVANQAISFPYGGLIIINEQSTSKKGSQGTINVTALHVLFPNVADVKVASVRAEIKC